ncbi:MAG TPA: ATP-binding protein [Candidatus Dormibacteraeota bacterium]
MNDLLKATRLRLTAFVTALFLAVGAAATVGLWLLFSHIEYGSIDGTLANEAQVIVSGVQDSNGHISFDGSDALPTQTSEGLGISLLLFDEHGNVVARSGATPNPASLTSLVSNVARTGSAVNATVSSDGTAQRVMVERVPASTGLAGVLVVSRPERETQQTLFTFAVILAGVMAGLTVMVGVLAFVLAGRALRPVGKMTAALQQFTADAAHELRAPLALMRAELEVSLSKARSPEEYRTSQRVALTEAERLSVLADELLTLARADAGALQPSLQSLDLGDLVEETVERWQPLGNAGGVTIATDVRREARLQADPVLMRRLLDNLLDNAIRHTPAGGSVTVSLAGDSAAAVLEVADTGPGVPDALKATLFDRFTRGDAARGRETGGAGLGLALCRVIAELHGGTISVLDANPGAVFRVVLPRELSQRAPGRAGAR